MAEKRENITINYLSRDFGSIKNELIEHAKRYYPDTFRDFSDAGFGALMVDAVSYIGDVLSFYLDYQANESFLLTANEYVNILKHAQTVGYRPVGSRASFGPVALYLMVPSNESNTGPNLSYVPILRAGSSFTSGFNSLFTLLSDVNFADASNEIVVATTSPITGVPIRYAIKAYGQVVSGDLRVEQFPIGRFMRFRRLNISDPNVIEIISVVDTEGREYFEVDHLSQNTIYIPVSNTDPTTNVQAPTVVKPYIVPRRYIVRKGGDDFETSTNIIFGYGSDGQLSSPSMVEARDVVLDLHSKDYITDRAMDPTILIKGDKFGVGPANTTITVTYRANTMANSSIGAGGIGQTNVSDFQFNNRNTLDNSVVQEVISSLEVNNEEPIQGNVTPPTSNELRMLLMGTQAAQNRAVTAEDYKTSILTMPAKFGGVHRCTVIQDVDSNLRNINVYVINESATGTLENTNSILKENIKTWLNTKRMINDSVDILDAKVVNLGIKYSALLEVGQNKTLVMNRIQERMNLLFQTKLDIGESFSISDLYSLINNTTGVVDATFVSVFQKTGVGYSTTVFNVKNYTTPDGRFVRAPKNVIFEVKYPETDIEGTVK